MSMEARKLEEQRFHDVYRGTHELGGPEHERFIANKKYYAVDRKSREFVQRWLIENARGRRVLEYGCGGGSYSFYLASTASMVHGVDISPESIALCRERARDLGISDTCRF